ncbi:MAG: terpene cyclase/mutase family protein [Bryobacterales bacterium]|nr:terpene cyclase/mutase family protein [Bryobacterales bacterium]
METLPSRAVSALLQAQRPEGGWGYSDGVEWTEPTALALLALEGQPGAEDARGRASPRLRSFQRADGGWPPRPAVERSTWVTALAVLALGESLAGPALVSAVDWLLRSSGEESGLLHRLRLALLGAGDDRNQGEGWPWYPQTAAWVAPTALTVLALEKVQAREPSAGIGRRLNSARRYLWSRMCSDGGWNHGSTRALGYEAASYPETTGVALLALRGGRSPKLAQAISAAERHLGECRSSSGRSWLRLALAAHGRPVPALAGDEPPWRGVADTALYLLASRAAGGAAVLRGAA